MTLRFGNDAPSALYMGADAVEKVYLGETEVWTAGLSTADGVRLTRVSRLQFSDHFGFRRGDNLGAIANQANSRVQIMGGHRFQRSRDNFYLVWTGQPSSGTLYARWVPDDGGSDIDFPLSYRRWDVGLGGLSTPTWYDDNCPIAGIYNTDQWTLPVGTLYVYSDSARTQLISMRSGG